MARPSDRLLKLDAVTLLTVFVVLVFAVPSRFVIAPLGGAGSPALLVGLAALLWWAWIRVRLLSSGWATTSAVSRATGVFLALVLVSFTAAMTRPISSAEVSTAALGLVSVAGWTGLALLAADGIARRDRLDRLIDRVVLGGGLLAALGLVQFFTHQSFVDRLQIPGLSVVQTFYGAQSREGFTRPSGTALHPIEFGVVLSMVLPLAVGRALNGRHLGLFRRFFPAVAVILAVTLSVSRSALLCAGIGLLASMIGWPRQMRVYALTAVGALSVVVFVAVPGMLGSILGLFGGISTDTSAQSRVHSWGIGWHYFGQSPLIGRGFSTFLPKYRIFDNEYLLLAVEIGALGVLGLVALIAVAVRSAHAARTADLEGQGITEQSVIGAIVAVAASLALFDAFSFPMVPGLMFLLLGIAAALRRTGVVGLPLPRPGHGLAELTDSRKGTD